MKANKTDVRKTMEAKLERLRPIAAELEKLPALKEAAAQAAEEKREWEALLDDPRRTSDAGDRDKSNELKNAVIQASQIVRDIEGPGLAAQREIMNIESLLGARADVERLQKESNAIAGEGAAIEKHAHALRDVVDAIGAQREQAATKAAAELTDAADRAIAARLEGKTVPPMKASGAANAELASLDAELAAAQRQLSATTKKLGALGQRANELRTELLQAMSRVAELDYAQAIEDIRPTIENYVALTGQGHLYELKIPLDQTRIQALANQLEAESRGLATGSAVGCSGHAECRRLH
jgi:hypothetical protein